jgi:glycosyltransferase involved in cell wall biosynthesis
LKTICIVAGCLNEKGNIKVLYERFKNVFEQLHDYEFSLLLIDNFSSDGTREEIAELCNNDKRVRAILNSRNFGHIRSPYHAFINSHGDAVFTTVSDLQVDPELIIDFIKEWEKGADIVIGVKQEEESISILNICSKIYYYLMNKLSDTPQRRNFIGIGLYDKKVVDAIKLIRDPYPYFRGLVFEVGFKISEVIYKNRARKKGVTKNNIFTLYDLAMLGICTHSKVPLRVAVIVGFLTALLSLLLGMFYLFYKIIYWDSFRLGMAPLVIGLFFLGSIQLIFLGIIGEYIGFILTKIQNRPLVFEEKRINF